MTAKIHITKHKDDETKYDKADRDRLAYACTVSDDFVSKCAKENGYTEEHGYKIHRNIFSTYYFVDFRDESLFGGQSVEVCMRMDQRQYRK